MQKQWKDELYKYITGIVQNNKSKMLAINGMSDHIHIFVGYKPSTSIPDLIKDIKLASGSWINNNKLTKQRFNWQEGYGAFSYSHQHIDKVCKYIRDQELHHQKKTFREEYLDFLKEYKIEFEDKYLFEFFEDAHSTPTETQGKHGSGK
ncbi:MAG: IS200/IS605 family transposase [Bacteroidota bacterium]|nr:IS200/IS605 family transposase [Bacteroidota bacterium]